MLDGNILMLVHPASGDNIFYKVMEDNSIIENEKFHLQPDATYIISNHSIPDAKSHALEFKTNPRGTVKSVKEVK